MFVCLCNGITERGVRAAIAAGARTPEAIYAFHGVQPQCWACEPEFAQAVDAYVRDLGTDELAGHPT